MMGTDRKDRRTDAGDDNNPSAEEAEGQQDRHWNAEKSPFRAILWPLDGQNLANVAQKRINSEHSSNKFTHCNVWI